MNPDDHQTIAAVAALLMWPIASMCIFVGCKSISQALIWTVLGAQLLLPVGATIKFQMVPPIDKLTVTNLSALVGCLIFARQRSAKPSRKFGLVEIFLILNIFTPIVTSMNNRDDIIIGDLFIPGVGLYDALSAAEATLLALIPFMLGRHFLRTAADCENILLALAIAGLVYSVPMLFEIRFSPQLHNWIYGYYPGDFVQAMREGGFRPMVFMGHGLLAAFFVMTSVLGATAFWRNRRKIGFASSSVVASYLGLLLLLCKSKVALLYGVVGGFLVMFAKPRMQFRVSVLLVTISLMYPMLRSFDLVPTTRILDVVNSLDKDRGQSLQTRFDNEDRLLKRAFEKPMFGWGRFGRNRVYDASGRDVTITDGRWIIDLGQFGLVGFLAEFGLLALCVFRAASALRFVRSVKEQVSFAALALILSINIFDLLPNSGLIPWTWLVSGALLGRAEALELARRSGRSGERLGGPAVALTRLTFSPTPTSVVRRNEKIELIDQRPPMK